MAKIQAIKCPQCGSPRQTYLGDDKYKCNDCGSTYFIDKEKVEVNVKHTYAPDTPAPAPKINKVAFIGILVVSALVFTPMIILSLKNSSRNSSGVYTTGTSKYYDSAESIFGYVYNDQPVSVLLCRRTYRETESLHSMVLKVFDTSNKLIKESIMSPKEPYSGFDKVDEIQIFDDGSVWLFSDTKIYRLNTSTMDTEYMNDYFASKYHELSSGIASVKRRYDEDGFEIKTNLAEQYFLYPSIELVVNDKDRKKLSDKYIGRGLNGKEMPAMYYVFSFDFDKEQRQLYRVDWMYYKGGPNFVFAPNDQRLEKGLGWAKSNYKITDCRELTPGRIYFNPTVAYSSPDTALIAYKPTAAKDVKTIFQCLNGKGDILWTMPNANIRDNFNTPRYVVHKGEYFMLSDGFSVLALDKNGKQVMSVQSYNDDAFTKQSLE